MQTNVADNPQAIPQPANDNGPPRAGSHEMAIGKPMAAMITIARLLGRQIAREEFERQVAANDNQQPTR